MVRKERYLSYLLRLWQAGAGKPLQWRASLESPHGGDRLSFVSLGDLFAFLEQETGSTAPGLRDQAEEGK
jgi:hypothetical protein